MQNEEALFLGYAHVTQRPLETTDGPLVHFLVGTIAVGS